MFKDERIDFELSKIYRNTIIITSFISLIVGVLRFIKYVPLFEVLYFSDYIKLYFPMIYPESLIVVAGLIILVGGLIMSFSKRDERLFFLKNKYYTVCFRIFFVVIILSLGLYLNFMTLVNDNSNQPIESLTNSVYYYFIFTVLVYFTYCFKKKDICINYSYVSLRTKGFCLKTLLNIIKMAFLLFIPFFGGRMLYVYCADKLESKLFKFETPISDFIWVYAVVAFIISLTYLILSVGEKLYYNDYDLRYNSNRGLKFLFFTTAFLSVVKICCSTYSSCYIFSYSGSYSDEGYLAKLLFLTNLNNVLNTLYSFFALACISYVIVLFSNSKKIKITGLAVIFVKSFTVLSSAFSIPLMFVDTNKMLKFLNISLQVDEVSFYVLMAVVFMFLVALSMEVASKRLMFTAVSAYVFYCLANIIIPSSSDSLVLIINSVIYLILLSLTYIFGNIAFFKNDKELSEIES